MREAGDHGKNGLLCKLKQIKKMILTNEIFQKGKSSNGGWNKKQLKSLGLDDFKRGWQKELIGKDYPESTIKEFLSLKDYHFTKEKAEILQLRSKGLKFEPCTENLPYQDQYKHPNWQRMRLVILKRDNFRCVECKNASIMLHVHHIKYNRKGFIWQVPLWYLVTLCEDCHSEEHGRDLRSK